MATTGRASTPSTTDPQILKRSWLDLLPKEQVIEIVFKLEEHTPAEFQSRIWPTDLHAAIQSLKEAVSDTPVDNQQPEQHPTAPEGVEEQSSAEGCSGDSPTGIVAPEAAQVEEPPSVQIPQQAPGPPHISYYQTPYRLQYPIPPPPHSSETPPPAGGRYPYPPFPPFDPSQPPHPYPYPPYHLHPPPPDPNGNPPLFTSAPLHRNPPGLKGSSKGSTPKAEDGDDLPSYEEMIVEALLHYNDPSGTAPKDLFAWMASRYPLQSNFRPSASQALQKAFKRGRFEKSNEGRYRLNATWEGGNTSRRSTRRPQPQTQPVQPPPPQHPGPSSGSYPGPPHPGQAPYPPWPFQPPENGPSPPTAPPLLMDEGNAGGTGCGAGTESAEQAWEAAQSILQALNFGSLLQAHNASQPPPSAPSPCQGDAGTSLPSQPYPPPPAHSEVPQMELAHVSTAREGLRSCLNLLASQLEQIANETDPT